MVDIRLSLFASEWYCSFVRNICMVNSSGRAFWLHIVASYDCCCWLRGTSAHNIMPFVQKCMRLPVLLLLLVSWLWFRCRQQGYAVVEELRLHICWSLASLRKIRTKTISCCLSKSHLNSSHISYYQHNFPRGLPSLIRQEWLRIVAFSWRHFQSSIRFRSLLSWAECKHLWSLA